VCSIRFKERRQIYKLYKSLLAFVVPQGTTLLEVCRETLLGLGENLIGHPVRVVDARWVGRPAYLTALRARAYSAAQLSAKETG